MTRVDLNADLGEGFGRWRLPDDTLLLDFVTSANVACGFHAGDPLVMRQTVAEAARRGVTIGAHPGYPDLQGFGRRALDLSPDEIEAFVLVQIGALDACCRAAGTRLRYVKPHGAMYNRAVHDRPAADAIARAVWDAGNDLVLLGLPGSEFVPAANASGVPFAAEAFIDRGYMPDGSLVPRSRPDALVHDPAECAERAARMVLDGTVVAVDGSVLELRPDSLCVHGDGANARQVLEAVRTRLTAEGVTLAPFAP